MNQKNMELHLLPVESKSQIYADFVDILAALRNKELLEIFSDNIRTAKNVGDSGNYLDILKNDCLGYRKDYEENPSNRQLLSNLIDTNLLLTHGDKRRSLNLPEAKYNAGFMTGRVSFYELSAPYNRFSDDIEDDGIFTGLFTYCDIKIPLNLDKLAELRIDVEEGGLEGEYILTFAPEETKLIIKVPEKYAPIAEKMLDSINESYAPSK